jgi:hypothetical protein
VRWPQQIENFGENLACYAGIIHVHANAMKCAAVFVFISMVLVSSDVFGVLRPLFPTRATPPFRGEIIAAGDEMIQHSSGTAPARVPK